MAQTAEQWGRMMYGDYAIWRDGAQRSQAIIPPPRARSPEIGRGRGRIAVSAPALRQQRARIWRSGFSGLDNEPASCHCQKQPLPAAPNIFVVAVAAGIIGYLLGGKRGRF